VLSDVLKRKDIYNFFSRSAFEKAYVYQGQGRVSELKISDDLTRIRAEVEGNAPEDYQVDIKLEFKDGQLQRLNGYCTCPMAFIASTSRRRYSKPLRISSRRSAASRKRRHHDSRFVARSRRHHRLSCLMKSAPGWKRSARRRVETIIRPIRSSVCCIVCIHPRRAPSCLSWRYPCFRCVFLDWIGRLFAEARL
jgi:hypothetical protein